MSELCPTCKRPLPEYRSDPTERELDVLAAWWLTKSVKEAAAALGIKEQRAKNLLARCRGRSAVHTNDELVVIHLEELRVRVGNAMTHNKADSAAA